MSSEISRESSWQNHPVLVCGVNGASAYVATQVTIGGFIRKSCQQTGTPIPQMRVGELLKTGYLAGRCVAVIIAGQTVSEKMLREMIEDPLARSSLAQEQELAGLYRVCMASMPVVTGTMIGASSSLPLAIFQGYSNGLSAVEAMKAFSMKQAILITGREAGFLTGLIAAGPFSQWMQEQLGEHPVVKYGAIGISNMVGAVIGHGCDTKLSRAQMSCPEISWKDAWMKGGLTRCGTVAVFGIVFHASKEILNKTMTSLSK